jgi:hypothetical protein
MLEVPAELNAMVPALRKLLAEARTQVARGRTSGPVDYVAFERTVMERCQAVERSVHEVALAALDVDEPKVLINKVLHLRVLRSETGYMTQAGECRVLRTLFRPACERNAPVVDPVALRAGMIEGVWLPATAREMAFEMQQRTSREAEASGCHLGRLPYSHASFERVAHAVGERYVQQHQQIEQALIEAYEVPQEAASVSVSLDRVAVPMEEPRPRPVGRPAKDAPKRPIDRAWRMAYCGTVTLHDADGKAIHTIRYGTMPDGAPQALCAGMADDVVSVLAQRPDLRASLLCDGAQEMWNLLEREFKKAPFGSSCPVWRLIDFWHVIEKLAPAARVVAGEQQSGSVLARWKMRLHNVSRAREEILDELVASGMEDVQVGDDKPVHEAITYLTNNHDRMDYAAARRRGLPIGSGNVEATCKSLVGVRMKRPGARWKNRTGEHILHLRALALSDRWDPAMDLVFKKPRVTVRAVAA